MNKRARGRRAWTVSYVPVVNPEIVTGVSLMLLFVVFNRQVSAAFVASAARGATFGLRPGHAAHRAHHVLPALCHLQRQPQAAPDGPVRMYEAALDLGCNPAAGVFQGGAARRSCRPSCPAFLISLTYSIDDFIISYFTSGTVQTLPIAIYSMTKKKVSPEINALSTIMFVVILTIILAVERRGCRKSATQRTDRARQRREAMTRIEQRNACAKMASALRAVRRLPAPRPCARAGRCRGGGRPRLRLHALQGRRTSP